eukprot:scaffold12593_cov67-Isochrysis_galbana.AAC.1
MQRANVSTNCARTSRCAGGGGYTPIILARGVNGMPASAPDAVKAFPDPQPPYSRSPVALTPNTPSPAALSLSTHLPPMPRQL